MKIISIKKVTDGLYRCTMENDGGQQYPMYCNELQLQIQRFAEKLRAVEPSGELGKEFREIVGKI